MMRSLALTHHGLAIVESGIQRFRRFRLNASRSSRSFGVLIAQLAASGRFLVDRIAQRGEDAVHVVFLDDEWRAERHDIARHAHQ